MNKCSVPGCDKPLASGARDYCQDCREEARRESNRMAAKRSRDRMRARDSDNPREALAASPAPTGSLVLDERQARALHASAIELVALEDDHMRAYRVDANPKEHGLSPVESSDAQNDAWHELLDAQDRHLRLLSELLGSATGDPGLVARAQGPLHDPTDYPPS